METDEASYIWYADFYRTYGDLINESEKISIGWIPKINALYSLSFKNITYENNDEKISKEEAISAELEKSKMNLKERLAEVTLKIEETQSKFYETESENQKLSSKIEISRASIENANENIERLNVEIKEDFEKIIRNIFTF